MKATEWKDKITIEEVKTGEVIKTENGKYYLVVIMPHIRPRFLEIDPSIYKYELTDKIEAVFRTNGTARILPTPKEEDF